MRDEWNFLEMQHFAVKIVCRKDSGETNTGSGTIVVDNGHFYVLTAGHCICYQNNGKYLLFNPKEISIVQYSESVEKVHKVLDIVKSDTGESDYAVLEIEKIEDGFDYAKKVKRAKMIVPNDTFQFGGYTKVASKGRLFSVSKVGDHCLHLSNLQIDGQICSGEELSRGCSGAGIFLYRHSRYYMLGYLTDIRDNSAAYSDFLWKDEENFNEIMSDDSRDDITVDLIQKWDEYDQLEIEQVQIEKFREENSEWMDNLRRKCAVLYPNEVDSKIKIFIDDFIRGEGSFQCIKDSNPTFDGDLQKLMNREIYRRTKMMPTVYESSTSARQDFLDLADYLTKRVKAKFPEDREELDLSSSYVDYQLALRLLNCSLKFKKS